MCYTPSEPFTQTKKEGDTAPSQGMPGFSSASFEGDEDMKKFVTFLCAALLVATIACKKEETEATDTVTTDTVATDTSVIQTETTSTTTISAETDTATTTNTVGGTTTDTSATGTVSTTTT
jgi:hypothetical protein